MEGVGLTVIKFTQMEPVLLFSNSTSCLLFPGGGSKRRGLGPRNDVLTTCKAVNPRASQWPSKAAVRFLMISTLAFEL